ncbi:MAG: hypothetical protein Q7N50_00815 [Armatimonadota bacterium]|nr:hypothetical protein [Armatimonadota bacterium]
MPGIYERLKGILRGGGYDPGDRVSAQVKDINGVERQAEFEIESYCGGGFAGQVYRAKCVRCDGDWLPVGQVFALKFFRTRSGSRRKFRDLLYFLAFQSPFPHQYNEAAVRTGLFITKLLRWVSQVEFGSQSSINDCYGTFWDEHVGSFAELDEWVDGRVTDPDVDTGIFTRYFHNRRARKALQGGESTGAMIQSDSEIAKKRTFMAALVRICADLGIEDLARQVYWWTGMSQANVLTRNSGTDNSEFVWVDRRPGLPGFLLSLGDFPLLIKAIFRGSIPPFDRIDFKKLRAWPKAPDRAAWTSIVDQLKSIDEEYHSSQIDLIGHNVRLLTSKKLRMDIARSIAGYWRRSGRIDEKANEKLCGGGLRMLPHLILGCVPIIGPRLHKFYGNSDYRSHVWRMLFNGKYRWDYLDHHRKVDLAMWLRDNRICEARAERVLDSLPAYFRDRFCGFWVIGVPFFAALPKITSLLAWPVWSFVVIYLVIAAIITLPPSWQMLFTNWTHAKSMIKRLFTSPFKYLFVLSYRRQVNMDWVKNRTEEDIRHGYVSREEADVFISIAGADAMQQYVTGIMVTLALQPASEIVFIILGSVLGIQVSKDFPGFPAIKHSIGKFGWWAIPLVFMVVAISPAGILRFLYCITQWIRNRHVPYGTATSLSLFRAIGDLAFMVQTAKTYPQFSGYLLTSSVCHLVNIAPVFGERGGLLNIWAATVLLSWPASFKAWRQERKILLATDGHR